ncbi:hypothetical protein AKJ61_02645 [candidate division MSBL1 archaeon SCGC-AAA259B11]|uniref:Zinc-ribbon domain-containing protein n=1 Tax=candidate division MSBL1 archaeon SCGC-AAA259B11 TaxID=1698260 RepID=A0A133U5W8_9EURY|nr:hypothetical protein AKJ61_02645 [candidate division MSBL1 archaeon SCGC-AAA259B11]
MAHNVTAEYETIGWRLARELSSKAQQVYMNWMVIKIASALIGLTGFGVTVYRGLAGGDEEKREKSEQTEPEETKPVEPEPKYCKSCGEKLPSSVDYCPSCGEEV